MIPLIAPPEIPYYSFDIERMRPGLEPDDLSRSDIARSIADLIRDPRKQHVRVIGVYGTWGAGKSQVLGLAVQHLLADNLIAGNEQIIVCPFVPWRYELEGDLGVGLVKALQYVGKKYAGPLGPRAAKPDGLLYNPVIKNPRKVITDGGKLMDTIISTLQTSNNMQAAVAAGVVSAVKQHARREEVEGIHRQMQQLVDDIIDYHSGRPSSRLVVMIDDLDRCSPENLVRMFEWLKVHLNVDRCTYVLALDHVAAARAIVGYYRKYLETDADLTFGLRYLEKLVDYEYELEPNTLVETMAIQKVFRRDPHAPQRVSDMASQQVGGEFPAKGTINSLLELRSLRNPRTMLKIVTKYRTALDVALSLPLDPRGRFVASYPFWLLFLITMYYQFDPKTLAEFVDGRGDLYALLAPRLSARATPANAEPPKEWAKDPKREFWDFASQLKRTAESALTLLNDIPTLQALISIIRQNVYVAQEQG